MSKIQSFPAIPKPSNCPSCGSSKITSRGNNWQCKTCGRQWVKVRHPRSNMRVCKKCGQYRQHEGKGLCRQCYQQDYRRKNVTIKVEYMGRVTCSKHGKRGSLSRIIRTNTKTNFISKRYIVTHEKYSKRKYKKKRKLGLKWFNMGGASERVFCCYLTRQQVITLGFTP